MHEIGLTVLLDRFDETSSRSLWALSSKSVQPSFPELSPHEKYEPT